MSATSACPPSVTLRALAHGMEHDQRVQMMLACPSRRALHALRMFDLDLTSAPPVSLCCLQSTHTMHGSKLEPRAPLEATSCSLLTHLPAADTAPAGGARHRTTINQGQRPAAHRS